MTRNYGCCGWLATGGQVVCQEMQTVPNYEAIQKHDLDLVLQVWGIVN